ncbi:hypothetical protein PV721_43650, partial [Streptomyces sp. MB09-01]|uniref:hypothetical protein n=1 Tax=Streptomyces sp. MB09-01 TaxID=3028666 RepID=UPI0029A94832
VGAGVGSGGVGAASAWPAALVEEPGAAGARASSEAAVQLGTARVTSAAAVAVAMAWTLL